MGSVYKKIFTKPMPDGAVVVVRRGKQLAEWRDRNGKLRTAPITIGRDGSQRLQVASRTYTAKYRDGNGHLCEAATGCRDEAAARSVLTKLERRAEKVRSGLLTGDEANVVDQQRVSLPKQFATYLMKLESEGTSTAHRGNVRRSLARLAEDCGFERLSDINREPLQKWLVARKRDGMGARTRNIHRAAAVAFCNWCVETGRLLTNPLAMVAKADEAADPRRQRRALTEFELSQLLDAARRRPLLDASLVRRGKRKGEAVAAVSDRTRARLELLGHERALLYKTLVLTGLRKGELASLTIGQVHLSESPPHLVLSAAHAKNRTESVIPLRPDLAQDLKQWLVMKSKSLVSAGKRPIQRPAAVSDGDAGNSSALSLGTPLFDVPSGLIRILDRDLVAAGLAKRVKSSAGKWIIDKRDERGRTIDVHALRHTFGTMLSKGGVMPRTAQAAMRHSNVNLTMNVYTDPKLLDVAGALDSLPALPLSSDAHHVQNGDGVALENRELAPLLAPTTDRPGQITSIPDNFGQFGKLTAVVDYRAVKCSANNDLRPSSLADNGRLRERAKGLEPSTSSLGS